MSDKNTAPAAQPNLTQPEKKDHTALIVVLVVVGVTVVLPMIIGGILIAAIFGFATTIIDNVDDWNFDIDEHTVNVSEGQQETLNKVWLVTFDKLISDASFAKKDCENMRLIAEQEDGEWFNSDICSAETISFGAELEAGDETQWIYLTDGEYCASYHYDASNKYVEKYKLNKHVCHNVEMKVYPLVDTGEAADPFDDTPVPEYGDDEGVEIHIRRNGKSST